MTLAGLILGLVTVFGVGTLGYGLFQLTTGGRAQAPVKLLVGIFGALFLIAGLIGVVFK